MPVTTKHSRNLAHSRRLNLCCLILAGSGLLMLAAGCGSSSAPTAAAADPAASPSNTSSAGTSSSSASREAYVTCLRQHGATVPAGTPATMPTSTPASTPATSMPTSKPGGNRNAIPAAAREACASLRPAGQGDRNRANPAVEAFDACMKAHGEAIPARRPNPAASPMANSAASPMASSQAANGEKPAGIARYLHGLNPDNAEVAAAVKACESDLPTSSGL
jgi:hypothetical protein